MMLSLSLKNNRYKVWCSFCEMKEDFFGCMDGSAYATDLKKAHR
jgi:hypothetical protein